MFAEFERAAATILLCYRTVLDHWCYTLALFPDFADGATVHAWQNLVKSCQSTYDFIVYIPPEVKAHDDGVREGDTNFQEQIDVIIRAQLRVFETSYETVAGTVKERIERCVELVNNRLTQK